MATLTSVSDAAAVLDSDTSETKMCRICMGSDVDDTLGPLIAPCRCCGSSKFVHRACLDVWRGSSLNPKALVECSTCRTHFRTVYKGPAGMSQRPWWLQFSIDLCFFLGLRFGGFLLTAGVLGFWPHLAFGVGTRQLHQNALVNHFVWGGGSLFCVIGTWAFAHISWTCVDLHRIAERSLFPRRSSNDLASTLALFLIAIGIIVCLYHLLRGIFRIVVEGRDDMARAVRGVNTQAKQRVVERYVVVDWEDAASEPSVVGTTTLQQHRDPH